MQPPLSEIDTWIFDLDNTLYPATTNVFEQVNRHIASFIQELLSLEEEPARQLQRRYFKEYGSSLRGLMVNHGVEPNAYLNHVHAIDLGALEPAPRLDQALGRLPGRKLIFTSASTKHARRVTDRLGVSGHFEAIYDIHAADYRPKPHRETYENMVATFEVEPTRAAFFEDIARNLEPAADMGMTTVWVKNDSPFAREGSDGTHIHHTTDDLIDWLERL